MRGTEAARSNISPELNRRVAEALEVLARGEGMHLVVALLETAVRIAGETVAPGSLPDDERQRWESAGANFTEPRSAVDLAHRRTAVAVADLLARSVIGDAAMAATLGVSKSRVSQRVAERSLYGFACGTDRCFPRWQLVDGRTPAGLKEVLAVVGSTVHPLTVDAFFTRPSTELLIKGEGVSPMEWLASSGDPAVVVELAADL